MATVRDQKAPAVGRVVQVIGPVMDVEFEAEHLPEIYNALHVKLPPSEKTGGVGLDIIAEVQQHIGRNQVRAVAMSSTDGLERGVDVVDTGAPISVPVGAAALGRILNVLGQPVDNGPPIPADVAAVADSSKPSGFRQSRAQDRDLRDRYQGH